MLLEEEVEDLTAERDDLRNKVAAFGSTPSLPVVEDTSESEVEEEPVARTRAATVTDSPTSKLRSRRREEALDRMTKELDVLRRERRASMSLAKDVTRDRNQQRAVLLEQTEEMDKMVADNTLLRKQCRVLRESRDEILKLLDESKRTIAELRTQIDQLSAKSKADDPLYSSIVFEESVLSEMQREEDDGTEDHGDDDEEETAIVIDLSDADTERPRRTMPGRGGIRATAEAASGPGQTAAASPLPASALQTGFDSSSAPSPIAAPPARSPAVSDEQSPAVSSAVDLVEALRTARSSGHIRILCRYVDAVLTRLEDTSLRNTNRDLRMGNCSADEINASVDSSTISDHIDASILSSDGHQSTSIEEETLHEIVRLSMLRLDNVHEEALLLQHSYPTAQAGSETTAHLVRLIADLLADAVSQRRLMCEVTCGYANQTLNRLGTAPISSETYFGE